MMNKKEYIAVDIFKVFCALCVASLHLLPFADISPQFLFWFNQVLGRIAVPFFFISSGFFFAGKIKNKDAVKKQLLRLLGLYLLYTVLHLNLIIKDIQLANSSFYDIITEQLFLGSYIHLWYIPALIVAVVLLYVAINVLKWKTSILLIVTALLYITGTIGSTYISLIPEDSFGKNCFDIYFSYFKTFRNGCFMGFPFLTWGYLLKKYEEKMQRYLWGIIFGVLLLPLTVEVYHAWRSYGVPGSAMTFCLPFVASACFLWAASIKIDVKFLKVGAFCRKLSFLIYGLHMFVHKNIGHYVYYKVNSLGYYILVVGGTIVGAVVIIWLSKFEKLKWLKKFY